MKCPDCETENIEGADVCAHCGASLYGLRISAQTGPDFIHSPITKVPKRPVVQVKSSDPVGLAVRLMQREEMNCVLVMEGEELVGIITGWDILQKVAGPNEDLNAVTCGAIMTPAPHMLHEDDSIALALNAMAAGGFRHLPIEKDGKPSGIVIANDLFRHISPHLV